MIQIYYYSNIPIILHISLWYIGFDFLSIQIDTLRKKA